MTIRQLFAVACATGLMGTSVQAAPPTNITEAIEQINSDASKLSGWTGHQFARAIPFNSTAGNVVPSQLKLFGFSVGAGAVVTATEVDNNALRGLGTSLIDTSAIDTFETLPIPMVLGHFKLGLPFGLDAGLRVGGIPSTDTDEGDTRMEVSNSVVGLDVRKILIEEGITRPFGLTLGVNFTRAKGHITAATDFDAPVSGSGVTFDGAVSTARTDWDTKSVGAQLVINKKILFINPYLGVGANKNFGDIDTSITNTGTITHTGSAQTASLNGTGGSAHETLNDWDLRGMLGIEFTILPFLRLGLGGELASEGKYGGNLGLRVQFR
jgi:hypothetical protein